jgi:hypothetical protein
MRTSFLKYEKKFTLQLQKGSCGYENIQVPTIWENILFIDLVKICLFKE